MRVLEAVVLRIELRIGKPEGAREIENLDALFEEDRREPCAYLVLGGEKDDFDIFGSGLRVAEGLEPQIRPAAKPPVNLILKVVFRALKFVVVEEF